MAGQGQASHGTLFDLLRAHPETTRTDLVRLSGLSKATVSETISHMMERGMIAEVGKRQPSRGRSQVVLKFKPDIRLVVGAQFTEHGVHVVLADLLAGPVAWAERTNSATDPEGFVNALVECVDELRAKATAPILGLGVGVPGLVDPSGRKVMQSVPYGWEQVPIATMLEDKLGIPVTVTNRAKAAALGEYWQGHHHKKGAPDHLLYVHIGTGIVAGIVVDGQLYTGHGGSAGELGHTTVLPDGPACACGNHGCLHMLASESALIREARTRIRRQSGGDGELSMAELGSLSIERLQEAAEAGDPAVREVITEAGSWVGIALANLINLMNPSLVVMGGSIAEFGELFLQSVTSEVRQRALWDAIHDVEIVLSGLGDNAGTIGGAALFLDTLDVNAVLN